MAEANPQPPPQPMHYLNEPGLQRRALQPVIHTKDTNSPSSNFVAARQRKLPAMAGQPLAFAVLGDKYVNGRYGYLHANGTKRFYTNEYTGCQISGLFYMGQTVTGVNANNQPVYQYYPGDQVEPYWRTRARQQYGWHVYCDQLGAVGMIEMRVSPSSHDPKKSWWGNLANVNALYPTVRFERSEETARPVANTNKEVWKEQDGQSYKSYVGYYWLTLGLVYDGPPDDKPQKYDKGDRYYVRTGVYQDSRKWGDVWELTDPKMDDLLTKLTKEYNDLFADYKKKQTVYDKQHREHQNKLNSYQKKLNDHQKQVKQMEEKSQKQKQNPNPKSQTSKKGIKAKTKAAAAPPAPPAPPAPQAPPEAPILEANTCWALYVCAGAKLVVMDPYNGPVNDKGGHNRVLVQQGGIVAGRGQLLFGAPIHYKEQIHHTHVYSDKKVKDAGHWFTGLSQKLQTKLAAIKNPVVFLAPLESEYGSIAWRLDIRHDVLTQERKCVLGIPEGGWFVAIEDWAAGIEEIKARHSYECLHESNVRMNVKFCEKRHEFTAPDQKMCEKIVGVNGDERQVLTDILAAYPLFTDTENRPQTAVERTPLPVIYRSRQMTEWSGKGCAPPMPPDWPLVQYDLIGDKIYRKSDYLSVLANGFVNTGPTEGSLPDGYLYDIRGTTAGLHKRQTEPHPHPVYQYEKRLDGQQKHPYDGENAYMGVNGWVYRKTTDNIGRPKQIGECKTVYYAPPEYVPNWDDE